MQQKTIMSTTTMDYSINLPIQYCCEWDNASVDLSAELCCIWQLDKSEINVLYRIPLYNVLHYIKVVIEMRNKEL